MLVHVGKFVFLAAFVILQMKQDGKVPLILGRPFLHTADAIIRVKNKELNLEVVDDIITILINKAMQHSYSNDDTCFRMDIIEEVTEEELDALLDDSKPFLGTSKNISESSRDHELEEFMAIKIVEKPEQEEEVKDNLRKFKDQEFYPRPTNRSCDETSSQTSRISFAGKRFLSSSSHIRSTQRR
nr:reverse transcriptase domain-containing protein [Tanacetum cinerariifolium]